MHQVEKKVQRFTTLILCCAVFGGMYALYIVGRSDSGEDVSAASASAGVSSPQEEVATAAVVPRELREMFVPLDPPVAPKDPTLPAPDPPYPRTRVPFYRPHTRHTAWQYGTAVAGDTLPVRGVRDIAAGILVDADSGRVLWAKNSRDAHEIASLTKKMTTFLALEAVWREEIDIDAIVPVTRTAERIGGSQVYLMRGEEFPLRALLKAVIIFSANDASHLVAEVIAGEVTTFVELMNERARELGMTATHFYNVHGLPLAGQRNVSSAYDMALLADALYAYPLAQQWASVWIDYFRDGEFMMVNRNRLVKICPGVDGLKTGYYSAAGFSVTATATREGRRMIAVVIGASTSKERNDFVSALFDWGFSQ